MGKPPLALIHFAPPDLVARWMRIAKDRQTISALRESDTKRRLMGENTHDRISLIRHLIKTYGTDDEIAAKLTASPGKPSPDPED